MVEFFGKLDEDEEDNELDFEDEKFDRWLVRDEISVKKSVFDEFDLFCSLDFISLVSLNMESFRN